MENLKKISEKNIEKAFEIISELKIQEIWKSLNSTCYLVGSVRTELLMDKLDIDFHVYSDNFSIEKSFDAISKIAENPKIKEISYKNLINDDDMCLEWHLCYEEAPERNWTIDIIHIMNESPYSGVIERVTEKIKSVLTKKQKETILTIKWECKLRKEEYLGIDIYEAVIGKGVETYEEYKIWQENKKEDVISLWEPEI